MKWTQKTLIQQPNKLIQTQIVLDNKKQILIREVKTHNKKYYKLLSLFNAAGEWIKSKLTYYSAGKAAKIINTQIYSGETPSGA